MLVCVCCVETDMQEVLKQIDDAQLKIDQLCEQASDEILAVERRYVKLRQPLYEVCAVIVCIGCIWSFLNHSCRLIDCSQYTKLSCCHANFHFLLYYVITVHHVTDRWMDRCARGISMTAYNWHVMLKIVAMAGVKKKMLKTVYATSVSELLHVV